MKTPSINTLLRADRRSCARGAPMGACDWLDAPPAGLYLQRVRMIDGDYAADGTYWGGGRGTLPLWCAFNGEAGDFAPAAGVRIYVRARDRADAVRVLRAAHPAISFKRPEIV